MNVNDAVNVSVATAHSSDNGVRRPAPQAQTTAGSPQAPAAQYAASATAAQGGGQQEVSDAEFEKIMEESVQQANKSLATFDRRIEREIHEVTRTLMYKIKDTNTGEVIAEYPPRKIQDMVAKMWELAGLFIDQKA